MDLNDFSPVAAPSALRLCHPSTGEELAHEGKPVEILVHGPDSDPMRAVERRIANRRLQAASRAGRVTLSAEQVEAETIERIAASVAGWSNIFKGGAALAYSPEAAKELVRENAWIRDQIDRFYADRGNFFAPTLSNGSAKSSARTSP